ncbi:hypothetical protein SBOR_9136 [Sclerotinia borealis F-4128]|uniref:IBR domain-containing protein n=1 Tax=Sclerotinia borealis (strain F-4128) TaxID=1432307 RepID=W9C3M1_SCLBF|nr:hypothetical protein SBOR_9136 [Sclerotinia borealis F-4128]
MATRIFGTDVGLWTRRTLLCALHELDRRGQDVQYGVQDSKQALINFLQVAERSMSAPEIQQYHAIFRLMLRNESALQATRVSARHRQRAATRGRVRREAAYGTVRNTAQNQHCTPQQLQCKYHHLAKTEANEEEISEAAGSRPAGNEACCVCWKAEVDMAKMSNDCDHDPEMCRACAANYLKHKIGEDGTPAAGDEGYQMSDVVCPARGCRSVVNYDVVRQYADPATFQRYDDYITRQALRGISKNIKACPNPDCGIMYERESGSSYMTCARCGWEFCHNCDVLWGQVTRLGNRAHRHNCVLYSDVDAGAGIDFFEVQARNRAIGDRAIIIDDQDDTPDRQSSRPPTIDNVPSPIRVNTSRQIQRQDRFHN